MRSLCGSRASRVGSRVLQNLLQAERGIRELKSTLERRPVEHRADNRIRSHVLICWLELRPLRLFHGGSVGRPRIGGSPDPGAPASRPSPMAGPVRASSVGDATS